MDYESKIEIIRTLLKGKHIELCEIKNIETTLLKHIELHKYLINEAIPYEISFDQAIFSWMENVYTPMINAMHRFKLGKQFPMFSEPELFRRVQDHLHFLSIEKGLTIYPEDAIISFVKLNLKSKLRKFLFMVKYYI